MDDQNHNKGPGRSTFDYNPGGAIRKSYWVGILTKITRVLLHMSVLDIPLRGHTEKIGEGVCEGGNFLGFMNLIKHSDADIAGLIKTPKGATRYMSPTVQNQLIHACAVKTKSILLEKIRSCPYFSLIMDTTQDLSKVPLLKRYILQL